MLKTWTEHRELKAARRHADEQLLVARIPSPRLAWRTAELTSEDHRVELGRSVTTIVHNADERLLPGATALDRGAVRECRAQLLDIAAILFDNDRSVAPRGILLLEQLLCDGRGALYGHDAPRKLRLELAQIHEALHR